MITTITLNPAIDATWTLDEFSEDIINRVVDKHEDAGGKAINISRFLTKMGVDTMAIGFAGGPTGKHLRELLDEENVKQVFIPIQNGDTRTNLTVFVKDGSRTIKINQSGPQITEQDMDALKQTVMHSAKTTKYMALSGKNPPGVDNKDVIDILKAAKRAGSAVALDSESFTMEDVIDLKPHLFKPNSDEFEVLLGKQNLSVNELVDAARELCAKDIGHIVISMGERGLLGVSRTKAYMAAVPNIDVQSTVGAGDSVVAGFLKAVVQDGADFPEALRTGASFGTAMATTEGTQIPEKDVVDKIYKQVSVKEI